MLSPCLVVLALGLAIEHRLYRTVLLELRLAVEGLARRLGYAAGELHRLAFEQRCSLLRREHLAAPAQQLETAARDLLPSPVLLLLALVRGAGVKGLAGLRLALHHVRAAERALAHDRGLGRDARTDVGGVLMALEDLDDALLQGVHIRVALGDVLLDEPPAGGHVRAANLGRQEMVEGAGLLGGANLALHVLKVPAFLQLLDDGGAGGRGSDAAVLALLSVVLLLEDGLDLRVGDVLGDGGHVGDECAFRVGLGRGGLLLGDGALNALKAMVAFVNPRVAGCRVIAALIGDVAEHGLETGLTHAPRDGLELPALDREGAGAHIVGSGWEELHGIALDDGRVDLGLIPGHVGHGGADLLRDDAVVRGDVLLVERLGVDGVVERPCYPDVLHGLRKHHRCLREVLLLEVLGVRAVVGYRLVLITQILRDLLGLRCGEAVAAGHVGQQHRQVVGQGRVLDLLRDDRGEGHTRAVQLRLDDIEDIAVEDVLFTGQHVLVRLELEHRCSRRVCTDAGGGQLVILPGDVVLYRLIAVDNQPEGRGLYATDGEQAPEPLGGKASLVHAEALVRHLAGVCRVTGRAALLVGYQTLERLDDVLLDVVVDVDAQHLSLVAEVVQHLINDELAFIVGVTGVDDALGLRQKRVDALHQVFLVLGRLLRPIVDLDGQHVQRPWFAPCRVHRIRLHQFEQVTGAGDDRVPVARDGQPRRLRYLLAADGACDVACEHRLLSDY